MEKQQKKKNKNLLKMNGFFEKRKIEINEISHVKHNPK